MMYYFETIMVLLCVINLEKICAPQIICYLLKHLESISDFANVRSSYENPPGLPVSQLTILGSINNYRPGSV